ncbi:amidase [Rhizoctonia solani AG-1 IA]|uniref:Amidase n=1 Tax=Thanatephorus cucumeris (strain AG1-IA) TaxID=983506 RepID=L8X4Z4_THACA|nr:amidase [Rhizoctonia solani AG-1 IA]
MHNVMRLCMADTFTPFSVSNIRCKIKGLSSAVVEGNLVRERTTPFCRVLYSPFTSDLLVESLPFKYAAIPPEAYIRLHPAPMPNPTIDKKQQLRAKLIDKGRSAVEAEGTNSALRHRIISSNLRDLVGGITKHEWTATQVVTAFIAQAIKAHDLTNCLTESRTVLFEPALKAAGELDDYFNQTGQLRGPLHDEIKGYDNTIGFTHWADQHANQDAELVALARSLGGVVIAKTNVPQTMLSFECDNPLWGKTTNPYNESNTAGGSSGGEAAVLRFGGSALGMGSDIGGSLRIPTSYCGVYSLKPTNMRFSGRGAVGCVPGFTGITTVYGPMARSVADVKYACEVFFGQQATVPAATLPPVKYRTDLDLSKPLKIGYFKTDRFVRASPACQRAVLESVEALKGKGHIIEEISPPDIAELLKLFVELSSADGYKTMLSHLQSDKQEPALFLVTLGPRLPATSLFVCLLTTRPSHDCLVLHVHELCRSSGQAQRLD